MSPEIIQLNRLRCVRHPTQVIQLLSIINTLKVQHHATVISVIYHLCSCLYLLKTDML